MDQRVFSRYVAQAVTHLYDHPYLQTHPLADLLVRESPGELRGRALQRTLMDAIEALRPTRDSPTNTTRGWRIYRFLSLRYVHAFAASDVARELAISDRQARRTQRDALDALASVLRDWFDVDRDDTSSDDRGSRSSDPARDISRAASSQDRSRLIDAEVQRLATGRPTMPTDLSEVLESVRPILDALAQRSGCRWSSTIAPDLPRALLDRAVVRQVLLNLGTWAFEHGARDLHVCGRSDGASIRLVLDLATGALDPPAGDISAHVEDGDRLAVCRRLVGMKGGTLEAHQTPEGNVRLELTLPAATQPTVLVVDDNPEIVVAFRRYLEAEGIRVVVAESGAEGVRLAQELRPDAMTLDVMMASQDGWETLQLVKNHPATQQVPVIICSVLAERDLAQLLGAAELLPKPVGRLDLLTALARVGLPVAEARRSSSADTASSRP